MSRSAELADVADRLAELGPLATLTAGERHLDLRVGARSREHIRTNPSVTLTWLGDRSGILHRLAGRRDGPRGRALHVGADG
ncbi:MAG: hypothetical protein ABW122_04785 [Ilumatobacteraceae bacterium]